MGGKLTGACVGGGVNAGVAAVAAEDDFDGISCSNRFICFCCCWLPVNDAGVGKGTGLFDGISCWKGVSWVNAGVRAASGVADC